MSEPMFPNGGAPGGHAQDPVEHEPSGSNRKTLLAVGGVVAAVAVAGLAFMMLSSGGGGETEDLAVVVPPAAGGAAAPSAAPTQAVVKPASVSVAKRDPFEPLFPAPAPTTTGSSGGSSSHGGETTAPTSEPEPVTPAVTLTVTTIDVAKQVATIGVDGKKYPKLSVNDSFGGYYTLYSIFNDQCVGVFYGDQSVPVCLNKPVSVTP